MDTNSLTQTVYMYIDDWRISRRAYNNEQSVHIDKSGDVNKQVCQLHFRDTFYNV